MPALKTEDALDLGNPIDYAVVNNEVVPLYVVGRLARALNRSPSCLRKWERDGFLPKPRYKPGRYQDNYGKRRTYTRAMIESAAMIAAEEGVLDRSRSIYDSYFTERVEEAWADLG